MMAMPFIPQLQYWAATRPHAIAVSDGQQALSYAQLLHAAQVAGARLPIRDRHTRGNPLVVVIEESSVIELAVQWCAVLLTGNTAMVLDAAWPAPMRKELRDVVRRWEAGYLETGCSEVGRSGIEDPADAPFLVGLSSGTSGTPKGFLRRKASWRESFARSSQYFALGPGHVILAPGPLAASMNLYALGEALFAGASFISLPVFSPVAALQVVAQHEVTHLVVVPALLDLMAVEGARTDVRAPSLQRIVCAGAALGDATLERSQRWAPQARLQQYYGAAELGFVAASTVPASTVAAGSLPEGVGEPFPAVTLAIQDDQGRELAPGEMGNICVQSPFVCDGYAWGDDGLAFGALGHCIPDGQQDFWYTVHDQGWIDAAGRLHVMGRAADMIVTSGANVYPHQIESVLSAAASTEVLVTGIDDVVRGQRVTAALYAPHGERYDLAACRKAAAQLPPSHRPTRWYMATSLPVTGSGKTSRQLLRQWIEQGDPRVQRLQ